MSRSMITRAGRFRRARTGAGRIGQLFGNASFRKLLLHTSLWGNAHQMLTVAQIYAIVELTDSDFQLALLGGTVTLGTVATALVTGMLADRFSRKTLLLIGSCVAAASSLTLAVLLVTDWVEPWHLQLGGLVQGSMIALDWTARFSITPNLVARRLLVRALPFDLATFQLTRVVGPLIWGLIEAQLDFKAPYFVIFGLFVANILVVLRFNILPGTTVRAHGDLRSEIAAMPGLLRNPRVAGAMVFTAVTAIAMGGLVYLLTPFGQNVLDVSAQGISGLFSAIGLGAFIGALAIGLFGAPKRIGWMMLAGVGGMIVAGVLFGATSIYVVALLAAGVASLSHSFHVGLGYITLMISTTDETRGRIAGIYELAWAGFPLGGLVFPAIAGATDERTAIYVIPAMLVLTAVLVAATNPTLRQFQLGRQRVTADAREAPALPGTGSG